MKPKPLSEQVVVVFGASSGIGRETARRLAARGARLVVAARHEPGLETLVNEIRAQGGQAVAVTADAADYEQVQAVADRALQEYGRLDTWVHNAGVSLYATFEQTAPEEFRRVVETNLFGAMHGAKAALPALRRSGGGALIIVSSSEGEHALPLQSAYAASKAGVDRLVQALQLEFARERVPISVTSIIPGAINTPFFDKARSKLGVKPKAMPPYYQPGVVAEAIAYAAEHPVQRLVVGLPPQLLIWSHRYWPSVLNRALARAGIWMQRSDEPKPLGAPDALFEPMPGYDRAEGSFGDRAVGFSPYTWLQMHPRVRRAVKITGGALVAGMVVRKLAPPLVIGSVVSMAARRLAPRPKRRRAKPRGRLSMVREALPGLVGRRPPPRTRTGIAGWVIGQTAGAAAARALVKRLPLRAA